jgi:hypothetical protein
VFIRAMKLPCLINFNILLDPSLLFYNKPQIRVIKLGLGNFGTKIHNFPQKGICWEFPASFLYIYSYPLRNVLTSSEWMFSVCQPRAPGYIHLSPLFTKLVLFFCNFDFQKRKKNQNNNSSSILTLLRDHSTVIVSDRSSSLFNLLTHPISVLSSSI